MTCNNCNLLENYLSMFLCIDSDLDYKRVIKKTKALVFAKEKGIHYFETSGKFASNIGKMQV